MSDYGRSQRMSGSGRGQNRKTKTLERDKHRSTSETESYQGSDSNREQERNYERYEREQERGEVPSVPTHDPTGSFHESRHAKAYREAQISSHKHPGNHEIRHVDFNTRNEYLPPHHPPDSYNLDLEKGKLPPSPVPQPVSDEERSFFQHLATSLYEQEIYGEDEYPSQYIRPFRAIGIKPRSDRTVLGKVHLATMMRMYLSTIRRDLIRFARKCEDRDHPIDHKTMMSAGETLEKYCSALENHKLMCEYKIYGEDDPFIIESKHGLDFQAMVGAGFIKSEDIKVFGPHRERPYDEPRGAKNHRVMLYTFSMALLGGAVLLGPMVLMIRKKSLNLTLVTVCVCVVVVSAVLALYSRKSAFEILGFTAAYAAVLVVFVGASS